MRSNIYRYYDENGRLPKGYSVEETYAMILDPLQRKYDETTAVASSAIQETIELIPNPDLPMEVHRFPIGEGVSYQFQINDADLFIGAFAFVNGFLKPDLPSWVSHTENTYTLTYPEDPRYAGAKLELEIYTMPGAIFTAK